MWTDNKLKFFLLASTLITATVTTATNPKVNSAARDSGRKIFCYYSSSAQYRPDAGKFIPEDIDPSLCSHVILAFVDLVHGTTLKQSSWNDLPNDKDKGLYGRLQDLKLSNPSLKLLLAVGGWRAGSEPFIPMISNETNRRSFIQNVVLFLRRYDFDGIDIDWEFAGTRGSRSQDKRLYSGLLRDMQVAFARDSEETGLAKLLLTVAVSGGSYYINLAYEPRKIAKSVDYVLLMGYNYHGSWNPFTGHHSGLLPRSDELGGEREWNQAWSVDYWLNKAGVAPGKLILGIATFGATYTLIGSEHHGLKAGASGPGDPGRHTQEAGILAYYEVCENLRNDWRSVWVKEQKVPYAYHDDQWVGYENTDSVAYKAHFVIEKRLGGAFIWSLDMDDFRGTCGGGPFPILSTISRILKESSSVEVAVGNKFKTTKGSMIDSQVIDSHFPINEGSFTDNLNMQRNDVSRIRTTLPKYINKEVAKVDDDLSEPRIEFKLNRQNKQGSYQDNEQSYDRSTPRQKLNKVSEAQEERKPYPRIDQNTDRFLNSPDEKLIRTEHDAIHQYAAINAVQLPSHYIHKTRNVIEIAYAEAGEPVGQLRRENKSAVRPDVTQREVTSINRNDDSTMMESLPARKYADRHNIDDASVSRPHKQPFSNFVPHVDDTDKYPDHEEDKPASEPIKRYIRGQYDEETGSTEHISQHSRHLHTSDDLLEPQTHTRPRAQHTHRQPDQPPQQLSLSDRLQPKRKAQSVQIPQKSPRDEGQCEGPGLFAHTGSCRAYFICVPHGARWFKFSLTCPPGLAFRADTADCGAVKDCVDYD